MLQEEGLKGRDRASTLLRLCTYRGPTAGGASERLRITDQDSAFIHPTCGGEAVFGGDDWTVTAGTAIVFSGSFSPSYKVQSVWRSRRACLTPTNTGGFLRYLEKGK